MLALKFICQDKTWFVIYCCGVWLSMSRKKLTQRSFSCGTVQLAALNTATVSSKTKYFSVQNEQDTLKRHHHHHHHQLLGVNTII